MKTRIITALLIIPALVLLVISGNIPLISFVVALVSLMGLWELYNAVKITDKKFLCTLSYIGAVLIVICNTFFSEFMLPFFCIWLFVLFLYYLKNHKETKLTDISTVYLSLIYIPFLLSHISLVFRFENGNFLIWFLLVGAFITDSLAYFTGVFFGKHKLCPEISPKKTIEGFAGGVLGTGIVFLLMAYFNNLFFDGNFNLILIFVIGILSAIISALGDLVASQIKREYGVKDYGSLLPGHGGILDRCDSLIIVTPFLYYIFTFIF